MKPKTPKRDPLTPEDCWQISSILIKHRSRHKTKQEKNRIGHLMARFEEHSYIHRATLEQAALIAKNPEL